MADDEDGDIEIQTDDHYMMERSPSKYTEGMFFFILCVACFTIVGRF